MTPECPVCGTDWDPACPQATTQAWDPTIGVRAADRGRHALSPGYRS